MSREEKKKKGKCHPNTLLLLSALSVRTCPGATRISVGMPREGEKCVPGIPLIFPLRFVGQYRKACDL